MHYLTYKNIIVLPLACPWSQEVALTSDPRGFLGFQFLHEISIRDTRNPHTFPFPIHLKTLGFITMQCLNELDGKTSRKEAFDGISDTGSRDGEAAALVMVECIVQKLHTFQHLLQLNSPFWLELHQMEAFWV